ncbi:hypothetical protein AKO1_007291 [Acrasis kona]|uniref:Methyltransferase domain-containing protein n=1 Tax=Acrasis kona TaxID=1008807 RepID=A0AAW2Z0M2_9EUKA
MSDVVHTKPKRRVNVYDHLLENVLAQEESERNPYIYYFATNFPQLKEYRDAELPNWRSFFNKSTMKKEITESGAMVFRVIEQLQGELQHLTDASKYKIVFFDCCSGKGFTSVMLSLLYPDSKIWMLDKDLKMNIDHIKSLPNINFEHFYIYPLRKGGFEKTLKLMDDKIKKEQALEPSREVVGICLASHLCVHLSEVMVHIYKNLDAMRSVVLSPCCSYVNEHNKHWFDYAENLGLDLHDEETIAVYAAWTMYLYSSLKELNREGVQVKCSMKIDPHVMSPKCHYIISSKLIK